MISLSSPLLRRLAVTPNGYYGADRPKRKGTHLGLDFAAQLGDKVVAAAAGSVARHGFDKPVKQGGGGGGNYVITRHVDAQGNVFELGYMHLQSILSVDGALVQPGDVLGTAGATGTEDGGVHLHFQMKNIGPDGTKHAIDPTPLFAAALSGGGTPAKPPRPVGPLIAIAGGIYAIGRWVL